MIEAMALPSSLTIDDAMVIARDSGMIDAQVAGELVGLHIESGNCYGFNATATRIWEMIEPPMSFGALCTALTAAFDVDDATCRRDVGQLIDELVREGLVTLSPA